MAIALKSLVILGFDSDLTCHLVGSFKAITELWNMVLCECCFDIEFLPFPSTWRLRGSRLPHMPPYEPHDFHPNLTSAVVFSSTIRCRCPTEANETTIRITFSDVLELLKVVRSHKTCMPDTAAWVRATRWGKTDFDSNRLAGSPRPCCMFEASFFPTLCTDENISKWPELYDSCYFTRFMTSSAFVAKRV